MAVKATELYVRWSGSEVGTSSEAYLFDDVFSTASNDIDRTLWVTNGNDTVNTTVQTMVRDEALAKAELGTLSSIFVLTVLGNSCVLLALALRGIKMTRMYYFLLHLCIADLVTAFFNVLPQLAWDATYRFKGGDFMCKSVKFLQLLGPYLSSYVLVVTAIDRYQAICFPLSNCHWTPKRSKIMIGTAWIVSLLCCCPQLAIFSYQLVPGSSPEVEDCWGTFIQPWGERAYVTWYAVSVFFLPLIVLTFTYVCICRAIWVNVQLKRKSSCVTEIMKKDLKKIKGKSTFLVIGRSYRFRNKDQVEITLQDCEDTQPNENNGDVSPKFNTKPKSRSSSFKTNSDNLVAPRTHSMRGLSRAKIKTVKITVVVILGYILCSTPFIIVQLWAYWWPGAQQSSFWSGPVITILMLLSSLNSCVNPWIYLCFNPNLLTALKNFCYCRRGSVKGNKNDTVLSTHTEFQSVHSHAVNENRYAVNSEPRSTPSLSHLRANATRNASHASLTPNDAKNNSLIPLNEIKAADQTESVVSVVSDNEVSDETNA